jgi:hypothetical protein
MLRFSQRACRSNDGDTGFDSHRYAQDHTVFVQPSCLIRFGLGGFFFENENREWLRRRSLELSTRPRPPATSQQDKYPHAAPATDGVQVDG